MWYCAHAVFYYSHEGQESFLVHENVYLIDAIGEVQALAAARELAAEYEQVGEDSHLEVDGEKAEYKFAGIRKLISIESDSVVPGGVVRSGVEVTYSVLEVGSFADVERLASGQATTVVYRE